MPGTVYVFNTTSSVLTLTLNSTVLATSFAAVQASNGYEPTVISVPRNPSAGNPEEAQFGGTNVLVINYGPNGTSCTFDIDINATTFPIANDLQLYIYGNLIAIPQTASCLLITPTSADLAHGRRRNRLHR